MASKRTLELILKITNQASAEIQRIKSELQGISISPGSFAGLKDLLAEVKRLNDEAGDGKAARESAKAASDLAKALQEQERASQQAARAELERLRVQEQTIKNDQLQARIARESAQEQTRKADEQANSERQAQAARLAEIRKAEQQATEVARDAELARTIELQRSLNSGTVKQEAASKQRLQSVKSSLEAQIAAERQAISQFEALPKFNDPAQEEARQRQIRASRQRTSQLTLELLRNEEQLQKLTDNSTKGLPERLRQIADQAGIAQQGIAGLAFQFNNVVQAANTLKGVAQAVFQPLIGANEQLNAQLLSSQTNLASATRLFRGGVEITDPTEKIKASEEELRAALKQIEQDTQSLVGVTSQDVNQLFQITLTNAAALNKQSKEFPGPIQAATQLTKGWAASLKVVGIPLFQANQEINSILKGQIDNNSLLAKNLQITSKDVAEWKARGVLVDELNKRLTTFVAGNAIAARSIEGISSNILDAFQTISREVGQPLLAPIIDGLAIVESLIKANKDQAIAFGRSLTGGIADGLRGGIGAAQQAVEGIGQVLSNNQGAIDEFIARLGSIGSKAAQTLQQGATIIQDAVIGLFSGIDFGALLDGATDVLDGFIGAVSGALGVVGATVQGFISQLNLKVLLDGLINIGKAVTEVAQKNFATLAPIGKAVGEAFGVLVQAIGELIANYGPPLISFIGTVGDAFLRIASGPIILVIKGLQGIVWVLGAILNNQAVVGTFKFLADTIAFLANVIAGVVSAFTGFGQFLLSLIGLVGGKLIDALGAAAQAIANFISPITNAVTGAIAGIQSALAGVFENIKNTITPIIEAIVNNPAFRAIAEVLKLNLADIDGGLKQLQASSAGVGGGLNTLADGIGKVADKSKEATQALEIQGKGARELGTVYQQLADKTDNALRVLNDPGSDAESIQRASKELIEATQQRVQLGEISAEQADKILSKVVDNTKVEVGTIQSAQKAIAEARKDATDDAVRDVEDRIAETQAAIASGALSEVQGIEEMTRLKREQLDLQVADVEKAIEREIAAIAKGRGSKEKLEDLRSQKRGLESKQATNEANAERDIQNARIKEIERAESKAIAIAKEAETTRQIEVQKLVNKGLLTKQEAEQKRLQFTRSTLEAELKAEQASLAKLQSLPKAGNPQEEEARQKQIRDSRQKTADLSLQLLKNEEQQQQALVAVIRERIDRANQAVQNQFKAQNLELQRQVELQNALTAAIDQQKRLLDARGNLQKAQADLVQSQYQNQIRLIEAQKSADQKARSEKDAQFDTTRKRLEIEKKLGMQLSDEQRQAQKEAVQAQLLQTNLSDEQRQKLEEQLSLLRELDGLSDKDKEIAAQKAIDELKLKAKLAEIAATEQEFAIQQQQLSLDIERAKLLQRQEQTKLRIAAIDAKAATAQAKADLAKARADRTTTKEQLEALELGVTAAQEREGAVSQQQQTQAAAAAAENQSFSLQRDALNNQQAARRGTLQTDLAILSGNTVQRRDQQGFTSLSNQLTPAEQAKQQEQQTKGNATLVEITGPQYDGLKNAIDQVYYQLGGMTEEEKKKANEKKDNSGFTYMDSSPVTQMRSLQVKIEAEQFNELVTQLKELKGTSGSGSGGGTFTINNDISGIVDPKAAGDIATQKTIAALEAALRGTK